MFERIETAKRYLWAFVELGFVAVLAIIVLHLLMGQNSGGYIGAVAENVSKFASEGAAGLIGIGAILAIVYIVTQRMK